MSAVPSTSPGKGPEHGAQAVTVNVWLIPEEDHWVALMEEYDIVGMGPSPEAAVVEMDELFADYVQIVLAEGLSLEEAKRPIPLRQRAALHAGRVWGNLVDAVHHVRHVQRQPHRAHCLS